MSETPRTDAVALDQRDGITHPDLGDTYMAWTDYWALRELARQLERELAAAPEDAERYRWLTLMAWGKPIGDGYHELQFRTFLVRQWDGDTKAVADAAIDAAIAQAKLERK